MSWTLRSTAFAGVLLAGAPSALADGIVFTFENLSSSTVWEIYATPVGKPPTDIDLLETDVLRPGESVDLVIPYLDFGHTCMFDVRIVFYEQTEAEEKGVDFCHLEDDTYAVTD